MKRIIISFILIFMMPLSVFGYNLNEKDQILIQKVNKKIDIIYKKSPKKVEKLYNKIQLLLNKKLKNKENRRIYKLLKEIKNHLEEILYEENESIFDLFPKNTSKIKKVRKTSTNNKQEIIERVKNGEKCYIITKGQSNDIKDFCFVEEIKLFVKKGGECKKLSHTAVGSKTGEKVCNEIKKGFDK